MPNPHLGFVFPGQGSQSVGMLQNLASSHKEVEEVFALASDTLGYDLWRLVKEGPDDQLALTEYTQPAMLAADVAVWRVWCVNSEVRPMWMAGHSLGEYAALVCADAMGFLEAVQIVAERARLMQSAVPHGAGAMAAILGLDEQQLTNVCLEVTSSISVVEPVNLNAPGQVVIAGNVEAVARAVEAAKAAGARRAIPLPISVPSHCSLMRGVADRFRQSLNGIDFRTPPFVKVIHNFDVSVKESPDGIREALTAQLYSPVRWSNTVQFMFNQGVNKFVECGPGKILAGLNKRIASSASIEPLYDQDTLFKVLEFVQ